MKNTSLKRFLFATVFISIAIISIAGYWYFAKQNPALAQIATSHYVRPSGIVYGTGDGSDWNNAYSGIPITLTRGHTYYIAGGNYAGGAVFNDTEVGATYIYIKKANASDNANIAGWDSSFEANQAIFSNAADTVYGAAWVIKRGYYSFDGITGSGTSSYGFKLTYGSSGHPHHLLMTRDNNVYNLIIKHIEFASFGPLDNYAQIMIHNISGNTGNYLIANNYAHNFSVFTKVDGYTGDTIEHNYFKDNWSSSANHGELISIVATDGVIFRYNIAENATNGTGGIIALGTYASYGNVENVEIYGNIFLNDTASGDGLWATGNSVDPVGLINWKIYNNTIVNNNGKLSTGKPGINKSSGIRIFNNLFYGSNVYLNADPSEYTLSNNYYNNCTNVPISQTGIIQSNESIDSLFVNYGVFDFNLKNTSAAVNAGLDLGSSYNMDISGIPRPQGSAWDIGAYEYIQASSPLKGDFNSDKKVNDLDFTDFKNAFKSIFNSIFDLNSDSTIDVKDLGILMNSWQS